MCVVTGGVLSQSFTWEQIEPRDGEVPPARAFHAMGYFSQIPAIVVFGGRGADGILGDTWAFDFLNRTWNQVCNEFVGIIMNKFYL